MISAIPLTASNTDSPIPPASTPAPVPDRGSALPPMDPHRALAMSMLGAAAAEAEKAAALASPSRFADKGPAERRRITAEAIVAGSQAVALSRHAAMLLSNTGLGSAASTTERAWSRSSTAESFSLDALAAISPKRQAVRASQSAEFYASSVNMLESSQRLTKVGQRQPGSEPVDDTVRRYDMLVDATRFGSAAAQAVDEGIAELRARDRYRGIGTVISLGTQATVAAEQVVAELSKQGTLAADSPLIAGAKLMRSSVEAAVDAAAAPDRTAQADAILAATRLLDDGLALIDKARAGFELPR